jgi:hypothetical protein
MCFDNILGSITVTWAEESIWASPWAKQRAKVAIIDSSIRAHVQAEPTEVHRRVSTKQMRCSQIASRSNSPISAAEKITTGVLSKAIHPRSKRVPWDQTDRLGISLDHWTSKFLPEWMLATHLASQAHFGWKLRPVAIKHKGMRKYLRSG